MTNEIENLRKQLSDVKVATPRPEDDPDVRRIYNYCVHLIARQDYSEHKLRQKLRSKPQNLPHMIEEAILKIKTKGLLREENYRRLFIRKWMMKGESEEKIRMRGAMEKLQFEDDEFETVTVELGFSGQDSLEKLIIKKLRVKEIPTDAKERYKLKDKVMRFLISKGHGFGEAKEAINKFLKGGSSENDF